MKKICLIYLAIFTLLAVVFILMNLAPIAMREVASNPSYTPQERDPKVEQIYREAAAASVKHNGRPLT